MSGHFRSFFTRRLIVLAALLGLTGCAGPIVAGLTGAQLLSLAGLSSTIMTGRDLTEHAVSTVTGKDCRFLETLLRNGRSFCETPNTAATRDDFHGVLALIRKEPGTSDVKVADASLDPQLLGFVPVDRRAAEDFSLEIARKQNQIDAPMLSFGMLSASFGSSFSYSLKIRNAPPREVALAETTGAQ